MGFFTLVITFLALLAWVTATRIYAPAADHLALTYAREVVLFLLITTWTIYFYLYRSRARNHFLQLFLLTMVLKMIGALVFCVVVVIGDPLHATPNMVFFLLLYGLFTAVEIAFLYPLITRRKGA